MNTTSLRQPVGHGSETILVGASPAIAALRAAIDKLVASDAPVLLCGETGVGKELVARLIHQHSARRAGPFVAMNCASQSGEGLAGEGLAGKGLAGEGLAGNGAIDGGTFAGEAAHGGTLFLDEIGELGPAGQLSLLRFLEDGSFARHGQAPGRADVRVITADHGDLAACVASGTFRDELYYRLGALQLRIPPLRERDGDLDLLAAHFLAEFASQHGRPELRFGDAAWRSIRAHAWPGNVRELRNRILQAVIMCDGNVVGPAHLAFEPDARDAIEATARRAMPSLRERRLMAEREAITEALRESHGQVPMAARSLGISRAQLYRLIGRLRLPHRPMDMH